MKKRLIPATIAALAISLTSVVAPSAQAQTAVTIDAQETIDFTAEQLVSATDWEDEAPVADTITTASVSGNDPAITGISYSLDNEQITTTATDTAGTYKLNVSVTTQVGNTTDTVEGILTVTIIGASFTGTANVLEASESSQNTGMRLVDQGSSDASVAATDAGGTTIRHTVLDDGQIVVTPGDTATGPITLTITSDDSLSEEVTAEVPLRVTADTDDQVAAVRANDTEQGTGITLAQVTDNTEVSAEDEDGNDVPAEISGANDEIFLTPAANIDGPITVTLTDPTLEGGSAEFTISVVNHSAGVDDNDSEVPDENEGSSLPGSSDDDASTGGAIGIAIAAVVAVIAAVLGAIGTGIIQLPPVIANLLPF